MIDVTAEVLAIIQNKVRTRTHPVELTDRLDELGLESIDIVEAIFEIEEKFDIHTPFSPNEVREKFESVFDVIQGIKDLVAAKV